METISVTITFKNIPKKELYLMFERFKEYALKQFGDISDVDPEMIFDYGYLCNVNLKDRFNEVLAGNIALQLIQSGIKNAN